MARYGRGFGWAREMFQWGPHFGELIGGGGYDRGFRNRGGYGGGYGPGRYDRAYQANNFGGFIGGAYPGNFGGYGGAYARPGYEVRGGYRPAPPYDLGYRGFRRR